MNNELKAGALFAGIGGFCVGFRQAGIPTEWAVELDSAAVTTYEANIGKKHFGAEGHEGVALANPLFAGSETKPY
jgi:site-specific DNA-cytosine methylase